MTDTSFEARQKRLFDSLSSASECVVGTRLEQGDYQNQRNEGRSENNRLKSTTKRFRGKQSIFKRPEAPITQCLRPRHVPDYKMNPEKWTKYSLMDVDISDKTNTAAALNFLREREELNQMDNDSDKDDSNSNTGRIKFKAVRRAKSTLEKAKAELGEISDGSSKSEPEKKHLGSKIVMPEYVIGRSSSTQQNKRKFVSSQSTNEDGERREGNKSGQSIKLNHLFDEEDE